MHTSRMPTTPVAAVTAVRTVAVVFSGVTPAGQGRESVLSRGAEHSMASVQREQSMESVQSMDGLRQMPGI